MAEERLQTLKETAVPVEPDVQPHQLPDSTTICVIGGGPAGSYAACALAREGFDVVLLERYHFPRYHIGESMLPSCRAFLRFIGAEEKVKAHGFTHKPGAAVKLNQYKREGYTDFVSLNPDNGAWNVIRSEFDELLLRHASDCGVKVFEGVSAESIRFDASDPTRPVAVTWSSDRGVSGILRFDWLVDASGRRGIMATKHLKSRKFTKSLQNIALWGYWTGGRKYAPGTTRENAPWFEALTDETGWAWFIPLHDGTTSVGIVLNAESHKVKKSGDNDVHCYLQQLKLAPGVGRFLISATFEGEVRTAGDYSYSSTQYSGNRFRLVGDAAAFIDPFFSSGVHLAFTSALSAAASIAASIRDQCSEADAAGYHNSKVGTSYTRFLIVVLGIYKQIRAQSAAVLHDVDEDNFDKAFHFLRPVIQGCADTDPLLTEQELQGTMDFCKNVFAPTQPEMYRSVASRYPAALMNSASPTVSIREVERVTQGDEDAKHVLLEINARKPIHVMYDVQHFRTEILDGYFINMEKGKLGMVRA
ncbi:putative halogenase [Fistulina hepatica ATCC 64428]|uniref:Putative halogenase n=1 Tax=Fistulina hepatica ATCC 64428 TaxID=1128425 RepID=A0A0D7ANZ6_9AGAR|nr:putative halogenase [Fistulina hepatica ATCC 64428]